MGGCGEPPPLGAPALPLLVPALFPVAPALLLVDPPLPVAPALPVVPPPLHFLHERWQESPSQLCEHHPYSTAWAHVSPLFGGVSLHEEALDCPALPLEAPAALGPAPPLDVIDMPPAPGFGVGFALSLAPPLAPVLTVPGAAPPTCTNVPAAPFGTMPGPPPAPGTSATLFPEHEPKMMADAVVMAETTPYRSKDE